MVNFACDWFFLPDTKDLFWVQRVRPCDSLMRWPMCQHVWTLILINAWCFCSTFFFASGDPSLVGNDTVPQPCRRVDPALEQTPPFRSNLAILRLKMWIERAKTHSIHVAFILVSVLGTYCAWQLWRQLQKGCGSCFCTHDSCKKWWTCFWRVASCLFPAKDKVLLNMLPSQS